MRRIIEMMIIMFCNQKVSEKVWHKRLGHLSDQSFELLKNGLAHGISVRSSDNSERTCVPCIEAKQTRKSLPKGGARREVEKLESIHMDLCEPMSEPTWGGARYAFMLTDDFREKVSFIC